MSTEMRDSECPNQVHNYPLPNSFLHAADMADERLDAGWDNIPCPDCGQYGWVKPKTGQPCLMCDQPIHWSEHWEQWQHDKDSSIYCPDKTVSIATPSEGEA